MSEQTQWFNYRTGAKRVGRDPRSIKRWRRDGMSMSWRIVDGQSARVVHEDVLLAWFRQKLQNDPVHQQRMTKLAKSL